MPILNPVITVIKRNLAGEEVVRYPARVLRQGSNFVTLEARFNRPNLTIQGTLVKKNDRFIEIYYTDRWYNIFAVHDGDDDHLKGWYCNVGRPAVLELGDKLSYVDLALDLWVTPERVQTILDEDEFAALDLDAETRRQARAALEELQKIFAEGKNPDLS